MLNRVHSTQSFQRDSLDYLARSSGPRMSRSAIVVFTFHDGRIAVHKEKRLVAYGTPARMPLQAHIPSLCKPFVGSAIV